MDKTVNRFYNTQILEYLYFDKLLSMIKFILRIKNVLHYIRLHFYS